MAENNEELKKLIEDGNRAVETLRDEHEANIKAHDILNDEKIARIEASVADNMQKAQEKSDAREATLAKRVDELETAASRPGAPVSADEKAAKDEAEVKNFNDLMLGKNTDGANEYKAMATDDAASGGFFIPTTTRAGIRERLFRSSPVRSLATIENATIYEEIVERGDMETAGTTERGTRSVTDENDFHIITIDTHERYAMPKVTNRMIRQGTLDVAGYLERKGGKKFARDEATDFTTGDGTSKPRGFLTYDVAVTADETRADFTMQYGFTGVSGGFAAAPNGGDIFIDTLYSMQEEYQNNSTWLMKNTVAALTAKLKDSNGDYQMKETFINDGMIVRTIQGRPVRLANDMPAAGANALAVVLADFSNYVVVDPQQISTIIDPYTAKPHTMFHMTNMVGGGVVDFDAFKLIKMGTS